MKSQECGRKRARQNSASMQSLTLGERACMKTFAWKNSFLTRGRFCTHYPSRLPQSVEYSQFDLYLIVILLFL